MEEHYADYADQRSRHSRAGRRGIGYLLVIVIGISLGYFLLRGMGAFGHLPVSASRRNVIAALDKPPVPADIPENPLVKAAAKIEPAVVNIDTLGTGEQMVPGAFGQAQVDTYQFQGKGSGVLISSDGYIVTNNHVVEGASVIRVTAHGDKRYDGRVIGADRDADLAVVKIDASNLPVADLGDSSALKVGEYVIAIGNPLGVGITVTHGIVSATDRKNLAVGEGRVLAEAIQTDAPINHGNSGGALANLDGQLIGINTAIASSGRNGGSIGIGFAIPINSARSVIKRLVAEGKDSGPEAPGMPFLGIGTAQINPHYAGQLGLADGQGVVVVRVEPLTGAADSGIKEGYVLADVDGRPIMSPDDVRAAVARHKVGDTITVTAVQADGSRQKIPIKLGRRPAYVNGR